MTGNYADSGQCILLQYDECLLDFWKAGLPIVPVKPGILSERLAGRQLRIPLLLFRPVRQVVTHLSTAAHEEYVVGSRSSDLFIASQSRLHRALVDRLQTT